MDIMPTYRYIIWNICGVLCWKSFFCGWIEWAERSSEIQRTLIAHNPVFYRIPQQRPVATVKLWFSIHLSFVLNTMTFCVEILRSSISIRKLLSFKWLNTRNHCTRENYFGQKSNNPITFLYRHVLFHNFTTLGENNLSVHDNWQRRAATILLWRLIDFCQISLSTSTKLNFDWIVNPNEK